MVLHAGDQEYMGQQFVNPLSPANRGGMPRDYNDHSPVGAANDEFELAQQVLHAGDREYAGQQFDNPLRAPPRSPMGSNRNSGAWEQELQHAMW